MLFRPPLTSLRPRQALRLLLPFGQHFAYVTDMPVDHFARVIRTAVDDRIVQFLMLTHEHVARFVAQSVHPADVGHDVAFEQIEQTTNGVQ